MLSSSSHRQVAPRVESIATVGAVVNVRSFVTGTSAEDMDGTVATITPHELMRMVDRTTNNAEAIFLEQAIIDDQSRVYFCFLLFVLYSIG